MSIAEVVENRRRFERINAVPGVWCLLKHKDTGCGIACVIVDAWGRRRDGTWGAKVSYPRQAKGATDWIKPRPVPFDDLFAADRGKGDLKHIIEFTKAHGPCPYLPT